MRPLLHGAMAMGNVVIGLFFFRFFRDRRDTLFLAFGGAFWLLAGANVALAFVDAKAEATVGMYLIRLLAFSLIILGIVKKNRKP